ncbi:YycH family regulatory protein [Virgibacillus xinjiangensis]|uniref:YycH family regulatory protein n=1 Tax=Virgibacillus xinjiangensis TaxID=393090 RepID=A0ABV7CXH0_9BACI
MKLEAVKSLILIVLIGFSLLLSFGLWRYQPSLDNLNNSSYIDEMDIGGVEETKGSLIVPKSFVFHVNDRPYAPSDPKAQEELYERMKSWELDEFYAGDSDGRESQAFEIEIIFPEELPMELLRNFYQFDNPDIQLPSWSFKRIYLTLEQDTASVHLEIQSIDGRQEAHAVINNPNVYESLWNRMSSLEGLEEQFVLESGDSVIYLPDDPVSAPEHSVAVTDLDVNALVNALFQTPSVVRQNYDNGESYYNDGQRQMRVFQYGRNMEFYNPNTTNQESLPAVELLDRSIANINGHFGWTDDYRLSRLHTGTNTVRYRLFYAGYPVFNSSGLSVIQQEWRDVGLHQYSRPLFTMEDSFTGDLVELPGGGEVVSHLRNTEYNMENIGDIQLGYRLTYEMHQNNATAYLQPAWYMKYNGIWREISFENRSSEEGGS